MNAWLLATGVANEDVLEGTKKHKKLSDNMLRSKQNQVHQGENRGFCSQYSPRFSARLCPTCTAHTCEPNRLNFLKA